MLKKFTPIFLTLLCAVSATIAEVSMPNIFSNHMVLQRDMATPVWGKAESGETISVSIADQSYTTTASSNGEWRIALKPMPAGGPYTMTVQGSNSLTFENVLFGDVWFCSGQSNMQWSINNSNNTAVEVVSANYPEIRLLQIPNRGTQEPQDNFDGQWEVCSPETIPTFSAVGYFFGRRIHQSTGVPIGLVRNAWGGSAIEAWIDRETLEAGGEFANLLAQRDKPVEGYTDEVHARKVAEHKLKLAEWEQAKKGKRPRAPSDPRYNQHRPANIYNGVLYPTIGYGLKGVIWYQGESNAWDAKNYQKLFPLLITTMREDWGQGDFPFYWVQLADFKNLQQANERSNWAELREAQTMTLNAVPNVGEAVIIDTGEGNDIHPRDKQTVANRLVRHALNNEYGFTMAHHSPRFREMSIEGNKASIQFDYVTQGLYAHDTKQVKGFAIAGADQKFVWAEAIISGRDSVQIWSDAVAEPVAVRYAWADNPEANLKDRTGLPVTPFRTDDWDQ